MKAREHMRSMLWPISSLLLSYLLLSLRAKTHSGSELPDLGLTSGFEPPDPGGRNHSKS